MAGGFEQLDAVPGFTVPVHRALTEHIPVSYTHLTLPTKA